MTTSPIPELTAATFDEVIRAASKPVLVDVWAPWCQPCTAILPALEAIADEHRDAIDVYKLNGDEHPGISRAYEVLGVPTLLVFDDGELVGRIVGAKSKGRLLEDLADHLTPRA